MRNASGAILHQIFGEMSLNLVLFLNVLWSTHCKQYGNFLFMLFSPGVSFPQSIMMSRLMSKICLWFCFLLSSTHLFQLTFAKYLTNIFLKCFFSLILILFS